MRWIVMLLAVLAVGCGKKAGPAPSCAGGLCCGDPPQACRTTFGQCTQRPDGWCPGVVGDPCGAHANSASCRADQRCEGVPYTGESMVACIGDARCFQSNCPTKGCISRCEGMDEAACGHSDGRCVWAGTCKRAESCGTDPTGRKL